MEEDSPLVEPVASPSSSAELDQRAWFPVVPTPGGQRTGHGDEQAQRGKVLKTLLNPGNPMPR